jgi:Xaa-Pro dipeptidase
MTAKAISDLKPMTDGIVPIDVAERQRRVEKARRLMAQHHIDAIYLDAGTSLLYYTGVDLWRSERMMAALLPARGEIVYISPAFEEARVREMIGLPGDVRVWEEHESPYELVAGALKDLGIASGTVAMEESVRFFLYDGIRKAAPQVNYVSADPVTIGCRAYKTPAEIALMQRAADITIEAYKMCVSLLHEGMSQTEFYANSVASFKALGVQGGIGAEFGASSAFPHGSKVVENLKEGDVVLMDGSCRVDGYFSDISRAVVFGTPTQRQRDVWNLEHEAQAAAFRAAQVGAPCEAVDAAARKVITDAGFGPGYKVPGLPHRTGHGLGLDIHEWYNMVQGEKTPLAPGMCFTDEPMIAIYGEMGIRLEDCIYITPDGPRFFTQPSPAIDQPFAA